MNSIYYIGLKSYCSTPASSATEMKGEGEMKKDMKEPTPTMK